MKKRNKDSFDLILLLMLKILDKYL